MTTLYDSDEDHALPKKRGRGVGTVIGCFIAAVALVSIFSDADKPRVSVALAGDVSGADNDDDGRLTYKINKGHVVVVATTGEAKIDMVEEMKSRAQIRVKGNTTTITVDDDYQDDEKIKLHIPASAACRIELSAGLMAVKGLPCAVTDLVVRSGKMDVENVPKAHGTLAGSVSVGTVEIDGGDGKKSKSSGLGDLKAELPSSGSGPSLTARVDVGMLTVDVE